MNLTTAVNFSNGSFISTQSELTELYRLTGNNPLWFNGSVLSPQADTAITILEQAGTAGLNPEDYKANQLRAHWRRFHETGHITPAEAYEFDRGLSFSLLRYFHELHFGRIDSQTLRFDFAHKPQRDPVNIAELLLHSVSENTLEQLTNQLEPDFALYRNLKQTLLKYRQLASTHRFPEFSMAKSLHPGETDPQLTTIRQLITLVGDYPETFNFPFMQTDNPVYDDGLVSAVKKFQRRHGLESDGIIGKKTLAALNVPLQRRVEQLELAMERLRWLPELGNKKFIAVNIPAFRLWAFDSRNAEGNYALTMKVVVGEALDKQTPVFMADMHYLDFRPYWNIPYSIAVKEILPVMRKDAENYLARHDMEFVQRFGNQQKALAPKQESSELLRRGQLNLRQRPGKKNPLGGVKFIFPNNNSVYLHDTPAQSLFGRSRRDFSHGCIRVEDAESLAVFTLQSLPEWDRETIRQAMQSGPTRRVRLDRPIPVIIFYTTALTEPDGTVYFYEDIYGHDAALSKALKSKSYPQRTAETRHRPL